ncbi:MAG: hypothetical protein ACRET7_12885 [Burkholderiales bacterium]
MKARQKAISGVNLAAYPFQKYGMLDGVVKHVSADAQEKPESGNPALKSVQDAAYRALISLESGHLESQGRKLRLVPSMLVNAEIHLGTRTVTDCGSVSIQCRGATTIGASWCQRALRCGLKSGNSASFTITLTTLLRYLRSVVFSIGDGLHVVATLAHSRSSRAVAQRRRCNSPPFKHI